MHSAQCGALTHEYPYMHIEAHAAAGLLPKRRVGFLPEWHCSDRVLEVVRRKGWRLSVGFLLLALPEIVFRRPALSGMTLSLFQLHSLPKTKDTGSSGRISDIARRGSTSPKRD